MDQKMNSLVCFVVVVLLIVSSTAKENSADALKEYLNISLGRSLDKRGTGNQRFKACRHPQYGRALNCRCDATKSIRNPRYMRCVMYDSEI